MPKEPLKDSDLERLWEEMKPVPGVDFDEIARQVFGPVPSDPKKETRRKMRFGWYCLAGSSIVAAGALASIRFGIAESENARLLSILVLALCAGIAVLSLFANGLLALSARRPSSLPR
jgi:hypothetical protein